MATGQQQAAAPNPAVVAALRGEFAKVYNGRRLRTQAQAALVARFAGRGESLGEGEQGKAASMSCTAI